MFGGHTDYHGSRSYADSGADRTPFDQIGLRMSLAAAWAKLRIARLFHPRSASPSEDWLVRRGERHFTVLGQSQWQRSSRVISELLAIANDREPPRRS